jgi:hypothetical protein
MNQRPTPRQVNAALGAMAGDAWALEAERIAALPTLMDRALAISVLFEERTPDRGAILGRVERLWAQAIVAMPDRDARRLALAAIPPGQARIVEQLVRHLYELRRQEAGVGG